MYSPFDVRVLDLEGTAVAKSTTQSVEFTCPARQSITQCIVDHLMKFVYFFIHSGDEYGKSGLALQGDHEARWSEYF